jgi:hypothetical protein
MRALGASVRYPNAADGHSPVERAGMPDPALIHPSRAVCSRRSGASAAALSPRFRRRSRISLYDGDQQIGPALAPRRRKMMGCEEKQIRRQMVTHGVAVGGEVGPRTLSRWDTGSIPVETT